MEGSGGMPKKDQERMAETKGRLRGGGRKGKIMLWAC